MYSLCRFSITMPMAPCSTTISKFSILQKIEHSVEKRKALQEKKNTTASKGKEVGEVKEKGDSPHIGKKRIKDPTPRRAPLSEEGEEVED